MNAENTRKLLQRFPDLFDREHPKRGFECQDGWFGLIYRISEELEEYLNQASCTDALRIIAVHQKMGGLCVESHGGDEAIQQVIQAGEQRSLNICELDGEPASALCVCAPHWFRCLCEKCAELHGCMTIEDYLLDGVEMEPEFELSA